MTDGQSLTPWEYLFVKTLIERSKDWTVFIKNTAGLAPTKKNQDNINSHINFKFKNLANNVACEAMERIAKGKAFCRNFRVFPATPALVVQARKEAQSNYVT